MVVDDVGQKDLKNELFRQFLIRSSFGLNGFHQIAFENEEEKVDNFQKWLKYCFILFYFIKMNNASPPPLLKGGGGDNKGG